MAETSKKVPDADIIDALLPPEVAFACEAAGAAKAGRDALTLITLGMLAGAFIAFGAIFMTVVLTGAGELPWGVARLLAGLVFSVGLILVYLLCLHHAFGPQALLWWTGGQFAETPEVLSDGGQGKLKLCTARSAQPEPIEA